MEKLRCLKNIIVETVETVVEDNNLVTRRHTHHIEFGKIVEIDWVQPTSETTIMINFGESGPIKGVSTNIEVDAFESFVHNPPSPMPRDCCNH